MRQVSAIAAALVVSAAVGWTIARADENAQYRDCVLGLDPYYQAIRGCFIERGRPLVAASQEQPETIALAVDGACQQPKAALARKLLACMSADSAMSIVEKYARIMRSAVISAVVQERAGESRP